MTRWKERIGMLDSELFGNRYSRQVDNEGNDKRDVTLGSLLTVEGMVAGNFFVVM